VDRRRTAPSSPAADRRCRWASCDAGCTR
jgi:hypothetical protein